MVDYKLWLFLVIAVLIVSCGGGGGGTVNPPGPDVSALVTEGKADLAACNATLARQHFTDAVEAAPTNVDANWGLGMIELMRQANTTAVALAASNQPPFRNASMFVVASVPLPPIAGREFNAATRLCSFTDTTFPALDMDEQTGAELYQLIVSAIGGLERALGYFDTALAGADSSFTFDIPSDWNDAAAGTITISRADALTITAAVKYVDGLLNLAAAYDFSQWDLVKDEWGYFSFAGPANYSEPIDGNGDSLYTLSEMATASGWPAAAGLKRADGNARLAMLVKQWREAFSYIVQAGDLYTASDELVGHWAFDLTQEDVDTFTSDWTSYLRGYTEKCAQAFTNGTVLTIVPALETDQPDFAASFPDGFSMPLNLNAFFTHMPDDLRDMPLRYELEWYDDYSGKSTFRLPALVTDAFTDPTMLGAFPGGLSQVNYDFLGGSS